jgi:hypothetical protein
VRPCGSRRVRKYRVAPRTPIRGQKPTQHGRSPATAAGEEPSDTYALPARPVCQAVVGSRRGDDHRAAGMRLVIEVPPGGPPAVLRIIGPSSDDLAWPGVRQCRGPLTTLAAPRTAPVRLGWCWVSAAVPGRTHRWPRCWRCWPAVRRPVGPPAWTGSARSPPGSAVTAARDASRGNNTEPDPRHGVGHRSDQGGGPDRCGPRRCPGRRRGESQFIRTTADQCGCHRFRGPWPRSSGRAAVGQATAPLLRPGLPVPAWGRAAVGRGHPVPEPPPSRRRNPGPCGADRGSPRPASAGRPRVSVTSSSISPPPGDDVGGAEHHHRIEAERRPTGRQRLGQA